MERGPPIPLHQAKVWIGCHRSQSKYASTLAFQDLPDPLGVEREFSLHSIRVGHCYDRKHPDYGSNAAHALLTSASSNAMLCDGCWHFMPAAVDPTRCQVAHSWAQVL